MKKGDNKLKKSKYRNAVVALIAATCLAGGLILDESVAEAKKATTVTIFKEPVVQKAKVKKRTYLYNKKGRKLKKQVLKKGAKISIVGNAKKIKGKKFYSLSTNKFVLASKISILKAIANKPQNEPKNPVNPDTTTPTKPDNSTPEKSKAGTILDFSLNDFRQEFIKELNRERTQRGLDPVTEDAHLTDVVQDRTKLLITNFAHYDQSGNFILSDCLDKAGISRRATGECLARFPWGAKVDPQNNEILAVKNGTSALVADSMLYEYIYNDAMSDWGHRDTLLDPDNKTIGVGAIADNARNQIFSAIGMIK